VPLGAVMTASYVRKPPLAGQCSLHCQYLTSRDSAKTEGGMLAGTLHLRSHKKELLTWLGWAAKSGPHSELHRLYMSSEPNMKGRRRREGQILDAEEPEQRRAPTRALGRHVWPWIQGEDSPVVLFLFSFRQEASGRDYQRQVSTHGARCAYPDEKPAH
jgi:hypothetical protein